MARIRTIKPEMAQDEDLAACSLGAQLLAVRLLNHADDEGYFKANELLIRAACFPLMERSLNVHGMITELSNVGYLRLGNGVDGKKYGLVTNFTKHQRINRPYASKIKDLDIFTEHSVNDHGTITTGKGMEQGTGNGTGSMSDSNEPDEFDAWWKVYPNKVGKKPARAIWKRIKPDSDLLIADVERRLQMDSRWREGFIPNPTTYLNQERWNDDIQQRRQTNESIPDEYAADREREERYLSAVNGGVVEGDVKTLPPGVEEKERSGGGACVR